MSGCYIILIPYCIVDDQSLCTYLHCTCHLNLTPVSFPSLSLSLLANDVILTGEWCHEVVEDYLLDSHLKGSRESSGRDSRDRGDSLEGRGIGEGILEESEGSLQSESGMTNEDSNIIKEKENDMNKEGDRNKDKKKDKDQVAKAKENINTKIKDSVGEVKSTKATRECEIEDRFRYLGPGSPSLFRGRAVQYHLGFHYHSDTCR